MTDDNRHERYRNFMREIRLDAKYLYPTTKQHRYPYVLRARPNHRRGIFIDLDKDCAKLQSDDPYNSYWYEGGHGYSHIFYDDEGHSYETDLNTWVINHAIEAHIFDHYINRNPTYYYDLMLLSAEFQTEPSYAAQKLAEILRISPSESLSLLNEEPRQLKRRIVLRAVEDRARTLAKLICQSGGNASIAPSLPES